MDAVLKSGWFPTATRASGPRPRRLHVPKARVLRVRYRGKRPAGRAASCRLVFALKSGSGFAPRRIELFARQRFLWAAVNGLLDQPINRWGAQPFIELKTALDAGHGLLAEGAKVGC